MRSRRILSIVVLCLFTMGLASAPASAKPDKPKKDKTAICHYNADGDPDAPEWELLMVGGKEAKSHKGHTDGEPGGAVPGMDGFTFDDDCVPQASGLTTVVVHLFYDVDQDGAFDAGTDTHIDRLDGMELQLHADANQDCVEDHFVDLVQTSVAPLYNGEPYHWAFPNPLEAGTYVVSGPKFHNGLQATSGCSSDPPLLSFDVIAGTSVLIVDFGYYES